MKLSARKKRDERRSRSVEQAAAEVENQNPPKVNTRVEAFVYLILFPAMAMPLVVEYGLPEYEYVSPYTKFFKWCMGIEE